MKVKLKINIIVAFSALLIATVSIIFFYTQKQTSAGVDQITKDLFSTVTKNVTDKTISFLKPAVQIAKNFAAHPGKLQISLQNIDSIQTHFGAHALNMLKMHSHISGIFVGDKQGRFLFAKQMGEGKVGIKVIDPSSELLPKFLDLLKEKGLQDLNIIGDQNTSATQNSFWKHFNAAGELTEISEYAVNFELFAPITLDNFGEALSQAPFLQYGLNTFMLVTMLLASQLVVCTLAAYAFARYQFAGYNIAFSLVLVQLMITPEILIVENYSTLADLSLVDTITGIGLPYMASAFGIFLLRQSFKSTPKELEEAARLEGCGMFGVLWRVYVPLAKPTYLAYGLVSISHHWNNFLWPLIVSNSLETRPLTVGLGVFGAPESGVDWSIVSAATLLSVAPLMIAFLLFQRQFIQSFMHSGIK